MLPKHSYTHKGHGASISPILDEHWIPYKLAFCHQNTQKLFSIAVRMSIATSASSNAKLGDLGDNADLPVMSLRRRAILSAGLSPANSNLCMRSGALGGLGRASPQNCTLIRKLRDAEWSHDVRRSHVQCA